MTYTIGFDPLMTEHSKLKNHLVQSGRLSEEKIFQAEDYALTRKIGLDEALVFLNMLDYQELGTCLSELYSKPYQAVLATPPPEEAKAKVPMKFAESLGVFPVMFQPDGNKLVLAIDDSEDPQRIQQIQSRFPSTLRLQFVVASRAEITKAVEVYYKGLAYSPAKDLELPDDFKIIESKTENPQGLGLDEESAPDEKKILLIESDLFRANALKAILKREGYDHVTWASSPMDAARQLKIETMDLVLANGQSFPPGGPWIRDIEKELVPPPISTYHLHSLLLGQEYPYDQMSETLIGLVSFLIRKSLAKKKDRFQEVLTRVRLTKRMALKLDLPSNQVDGAVLAAWLSEKGLGTEIATQVGTPYHLSEILKSPTGGERGNRVEANILRLVIKYQALRKQKPAIAEDIHRLRKLMGQSSKPESDGILEAFLHVIKEETLLRKVDSTARRILFVDPNPSSESSIAMRLYNDGYDMESVKDAREAAQRVSDPGVDLVISEIKLPGSSGLKLCRALKGNPATARIPFFFLTADEGERLAAECLEAGADDFLKKPIDLDLLSLKIQRALAAQTAAESKRGVSGSLQEMNLTDILQSLSGSNKNVEITLESMGRKGDLYVQGGEITHAAFGGIKGEEAFFEFMAWEEGQFRIKSCSRFPSRTIHATMMSLLMEGVRRADEAQADDDLDDDD